MAERCLYSDWTKQAFAVKVTADMEDPSFERFLIISG
jgi:hypothetical protein